MGKVWGDNCALKAGMTGMGSYQVKRSVQAVNDFNGIMRMPFSLVVAPGKYGIALLNIK